MTVEANLHKRFGRHVVLGSAALSIRPGEIVALIGESGAGKSTLAAILAGIMTGDAGSSVQRAPELTVSLVPQELDLAEWRTALENVTLERELVEPGHKADPVHALALLEAVGLESRAESFPDELSVGMRQRVQLCRALYRKPGFLLLDEPLSAVDELTRDRIGRWMREHLKARGGSALWITHDIREALALADRVLLLSGGQLREMAPADFAPSPAIDAILAEMAKRPAPTEARPAPGSNYAGLIGSGVTSLLGQMLPPLLLAGLLLGIWQSFALIYPALNFYLASPVAVATKLNDLIRTQAFWSDVGLTALEAGAGLALGLAAAVLVTALCTGLQPLRRALHPYLVALTAVPAFILAPAFIIWFGVGVGMKIAIAALSAGPIIALAMMASLNAPTSVFGRLLVAQGVLTRRLFLRFAAPRSALALLDSLRPAAIAAVLGAFLGEFISAERGLGYFILLNASRYHVEEVLVGAAALAGLALLASAATSLAISNRIRIVRALGA